MSILQEVSLTTLEDMAEHTELPVIKINEITKY